MKQFVLTLVKLTAFGLLRNHNIFHMKISTLHKSKLLTIRNFHAPCRIRTCNRLIRSQVLYPVEPRVLLKVKSTAISSDAEDRNRTGTKVTLRRILSPVRLPVPPPRLLKRTTGFEPATPTLARWCSTTELRSHFMPAT